MVIKNKQKKQSNDPTWDHCTRLSETNRMNLKCNYCGKEFWGGVARMKNHLGGTHNNVSECPQVLEDVRDFFLQLLSE